MGAMLGSLLGGTWRLLRAVPLPVYLAAAVALWAWHWHAGAVADARAAGDISARQALSVSLMQAHAAAAVRYTQAADAEGRAQAFEQGLNRCIGTRTAMDTLTQAILGERERARAQAERALTSTQQELAHAYELSADRCADQPVPAAVIRVLDVAAFGQAGADANPVRAGAGAAVRARTVSADGTDPDSSSAGTTYRDLAGWIGVGWAPALHSCNADKSGLADLHTPDAP
ncbi:hypothetical protein [Tahibacter harae]|uniref:Bacteriophage Rz lysis protein n=1 Tax=Tahibacter harae TaxID=2963937 RepID=A0ABT1QS71_9GAMM|nr:hypothetical protein [Tahibacter harae]MCQ4165130.1 hypothetical protein [Tahibacter harae]